MDGFLGFLDTERYFGWWQLTKPLSRRKPVNLRICLLCRFKSWDLQLLMNRMMEPTDWSKNWWQCRFCWPARYQQRLPSCDWGQVPIAWRGWSPTSDQRGLKALPSCQRTGQSIRTNNDLEGWQHGLNQRAGGRVHFPFTRLWRIVKTYTKKNLSPPSAQDFSSLGRLRLQAKIRSTVKACSRPNGPVRSV